MSHEDLKELYGHHREFQNKYVYFLLAVAASGVAFAIQKSEGATAQWPLVPLALAVLCFGFSFFFGLRQLRWIGATLGANYTVLQLKNNVHAHQPQTDEELHYAIEAVTSTQNENRKKADTAGEWQIRLLFAGGIFFIVWHSLDIYLNTFYR